MSEDINPAPTCHYQFNSICWNILLVPFHPDVCVILCYFLRQCIITLQKCPNICRSTKHYQEPIPKSTHWIQYIRHFLWRTPWKLTWNPKLDGLGRCFLLPFAFWTFCSFKMLVAVVVSCVFRRKFEGVKQHGFKMMLFHPPVLDMSKSLHIQGS